MATSEDIKQAVAAALEDDRQRRLEDGSWGRIAIGVVLVLVFAVALLMLSVV